MHNIYPKYRHPFCKQKYEDSHSSCKNFYNKILLGFNICPYGFTCYKTENNTIYCGYKVVNYINKKKINGYEKNAKYKYIMTIFNEIDFLDIIVENDKKFLNLKEKHEIYRDTIHDIKRVIGSIRDAVQEFEAKGQENVVTDCCDLINIRLDYHDKILLQEDATRIFDQIKINEIIKKLKRLLEYKASTKKINFDLSGNSDINIFEDSKAIFILFFIIMDNAVKYALIDSKIFVKFNDIDELTTSVSIENECKDLTQKDLNYIFERGYRGENKQSNSGNGIGLSIAKEIMDEYHISYNVELEKNKNNNLFKFYVRIPSLTPQGEVRNKKIVV